MFASTAKGPKLAPLSNFISTLPDRQWGSVCNAKSWTWLCLFFSFPPPAPAVTIETDGYFFLGVGRAIWLQCLIVIIADSDTLLAGSSLLLRQLPFNEKEKGEKRTGTAEKQRVWVPARARPGCQAAAEADQINSPHPRHMKRARKILTEFNKRRSKLSCSIASG